MWKQSSFVKNICYTTATDGGRRGRGICKEKVMTEQQMPLAGKVALVTGSSQGIGRATAERLARAGADIVINYRSNTNAAAQARDAIESLGRRCMAIQADVSQEE